MKKKKKLKKKQRSAPKKKQNKQKKSVDTAKIPYGPGFIEVVRKGKNIFFNKEFTEEQQNELLESIRENRPKLYDETKRLITRTVELINEYDKIYILGGIASYGLDQMMVNKKTDDGLAETVIEYCQSVALATENINRGKVPPDTVLYEIYHNIKTIRKNFIDYYQTEAITGRYSEIESRIRINMILETILIRGDGYLVHINELFSEMFTPYDDFFEKHYGFKSGDILKSFVELEEAFGCRVLLPTGMPHPVQRYKLAKWMHDNQGRISSEDIDSGEYLNEFVKTNPQVLVKNNGVILYSLNDIDTYNELYRIRHFDDIQKKVVQSLAISFGENKSFAGNAKFYYEILNESRIYTKPIIKQDEDYYLFGMNLAARNYFLIAQNLIKEADESFYNSTFLGNRILKSKDEFIEQKVCQLFQKMLPSVRFFRNLSYTFDNKNVNLSCTKSEDGKYELDILGISNNATYVIEVKASIVSNEAKRGAIQSIKTDLRGIIGNAVCQSHRAFLFIKNGKDVVFTLPDGQVVKPLNTDNIFKISISFSFAGTILSGLSRLMELGVVESGVEFSWTINIYDLFAFSELIESEEQFIDYLNKRIPLYQERKLSHNDEMDLLGFYFIDDLKVSGEHHKTESLTLRYKDSIDEYFERGKAKPKKRSNKINDAN
jgi:hypothetical protein